MYIYISKWIATKIAPFSAPLCDTRNAVLRVTYSAAITSCVARWILFLGCLAKTDNHYNHEEKRGH